MVELAVDSSLSRKVSELSCLDRFDAQDKFLVAVAEIPQAAKAILDQIRSDEGAYDGFVRYLAAKAAADSSFNKPQAEQVMAGVHRYSRQMSY